MQLQNENIRLKKILIDFTNCKHEFTDADFENIEKELKDKPYLIDFGICFGKTALLIQARETS